MGQVLGNEGGGCEKNEIYRNEKSSYDLDKMVRDKVRNEEIRKRTAVESIKEHLREQRLLSFGHMERMDCERPQSVAINAKIDCSKKGRPKKR